MSLPSVTSWSHQRDALVAVKPASPEAKFEARNPDLSDDPLVCDFASLSIKIIRDDFRSDVARSRTKASPVQISATRGTATHSEDDDLWLRGPQWTSEQEFDSARRASGARSSHQVLVNMDGLGLWNCRFDAAEVSVRQLLQSCAHLLRIGDASKLAAQLHGRAMWPDALVPLAPSVVRVKLRGAILGGKGGFGALLKTMGKGAMGKATTDFGACRDLNGRRLRIVNEEIALRQWAEMSEEAKEQARLDADLPGGRLAVDTPSGIAGWHLPVPKWAELSSKRLKSGRHAIEAARRRRQKRIEEEQEQRQAKREERRRKQEEYVNSSALTSLFPDDDDDSAADAVMVGLRKRSKKRKLSDRAATAIVESIDDASNADEGPTSPWLMALVGDMNVGTGSDAHRVHGASDFGTACLVGCSLTRGSWYLEVTVVSGGLMQLGVANHLFRGDESNGDGVGDCSHSWAYDGFRARAWHNGEETEFGKRWKAGDVVGVHFDLEQGFLAFTLNGESMGKAVGPAEHFGLGQDAAEKKDESSEDAAAATADGMDAPLTGLYPAFSLNAGEEISVNIGQAKFLNGPPEGARPVMEGLDETTKAIFEK